MSLRPGRWIALALLLLAWIPLLGQFDEAGVTIDGLLPRAELERQREARALFAEGSEAMLVALRGAGAAWSAERVDALRAALAELEGVEGVELLPTSVTSAAAEGASWRVLVALVARTSLELEPARRLTRAFGRTLDAARAAGERTCFAGSPRLRAESWELARRDLLRLLPWLCALALGVPWLFFRSAAGGLFLLLCAGGTSALTLWGIRLAEGQLPAQVLLILPVLWAAAAMDAMHLLGRLAWPRSRRDGSPGARAALREMFRPCLTTTATTAAGLALIGAGGDSELLAKLGLWAAFGVLLALPLTFLLLPLCFPRGAQLRRGPGWPIALGLWLSRLARRRARAFVWLGLAASLASLPFLGRLELSTRYPQLFAPELELSRDLRAIAAALGSDLNPVQVLLRADETRQVSALDSLRAVVALDQQLRSLPEFVCMTPSIDDGLLARGLALARGQSEMPASGASELELQAFSGWVDPHGQWARAQLHFRPMSWSRKRALFAQLESFDRTMLSKHELLLWGTGYTTHRIEELGLRDLLVGGLLTAAAMALILIVGLGSWRAGLLALGLSLWPMLFVAALMGALRLPWSVALLPLPGALLGIGVDDSIHLLWARPARGGRSERLRSLPAVLATTLLLVSCVLALAWTSLEGNREFGVLLSLGMGAALALDLFVLPSLAPRVRRLAARGPVAARERSADR